MKLIRSIASIVCVTQYAYRCHGYIIRLCNDSAVYRIAFLLFCVQKGTTKESVTRVLIGRKRIDNLISFLRRVLSWLVISCCCCCCEKVVAEWRPKYIRNVQCSNHWHSHFHQVFKTAECIPFYKKVVESRLTPHLKNNLIFYLGKQSNILHHTTNTFYLEMGLF